MITKYIYIYMWYKWNKYFKAKTKIVKLGF